MMNFTTGAGSAIFWLHLHWVFAGIAIFGFIAGLIWLSKHATKTDFLKAVKWTLVIGIIGLLLSASAGFRGMSLIMGSMNNKFFGGPMMGQVYESMMEECGDDLSGCDMDEMFEHMRQEKGSLFKGGMMMQ